jgi:hypothetical protein
VACAGGVARAQAQAQPTFDTQGFTRPLELGGPTAAQCGECHPAVFEGWRASHHRKSLDNPHFLDGFAAEPHVRCLVCHLPLVSQLDDALRHRRRLARGDLSTLPSESRAHEGITCIACHLRDGVVMAPNSTALAYAHPVRFAARMKTSEFCGECHEFSGHAVIDGVTVVNALPMQTTLSEWREWGGSATCQDCHMPKASHRVRGAHDVDFLRAAVSVRVEKGTVIVETRDVGHKVPTGDVFRHLVLWADDTPLKTFGLTLARGADAEGRRGLVVKEDSRLVPNQPVSVAVPLSASTLRLTYHYTAAFARPRVGLSREDEVVELHRVSLPDRRGR